MSKMNIHFVNVFVVGAVVVAAVFVAVVVVVLVASVGDTIGITEEDCERGVNGWLEGFIYVRRGGERRKVLYFNCTKKSI
jgi:hypothetical protein